ncbi:MAG: PEP-CTERM sorting domain-containing protein [Armatimonadetes bacterium]|nr:PEP-CTERM sorting domain-containing protein [Armatimonadota bacterium]
MNQTELLGPVGHEPTVTQESIDFILQKPSDHNDHFLPWHMSEYTVELNAQYEAGTAAVPEPSTMLVLLTGVAVAACRRLLRRRV